MEVTISVIVPVYNSEKYLSKCIESLLNQSIDNYEIIIVNDGSNDKSETICNNYKNKYDIINVINTENNGVSSARNIGISHSKGKYIAFVDSDDYCDSTYLENLLCHASDNRLVISGIYFFDDKQGNAYKESNFGGNLYSVDEYMSIILARYNVDPYCGAPYSKLYLKEILVSKSIKFKLSENYGEDFEFNINYLNYVKEVYLTGISNYYYRRNTGGSLTDTNKHSIENFWRRRIILYEEYKKLFESRNLHVKLQQDIDKLMSLFILHYVSMITINDYTAYRTLIKNIESILRMYPGIDLNCDNNFNRIALKHVKRREYIRLYVMYKVYRIIRKIVKLILIN